MWRITNKQKLLAVVSPFLCFLILCNISESSAQCKVGEVGLIGTFCCCNSVLRNCCRVGLSSGAPARVCAVCSTLPQEGAYKKAA